MALADGVEAGLIPEPVLIHSYISPIEGLSEVVIPR